ncbi:MAG: CoA transferase [Chloroflexi bacterium]|nr:CoA transferase [Chloroflexota bacterium]MCI0829773.1 CoA transferase [Chloroflexota bacterium]MCI0900120.1 CoA transferase [Chloroflexota bacterium]
MLKEGALSGLKVVELTDQVSGQVAGSFCARLLGDAGADVVKVEPPHGDRYRRNGPYPGGVPDPEWSGLFLYLNSNKRGVSLDIESAGGWAAFLDLTAASDFLVLGQNSSEIERLGLRRERFSDANPGLIVTAITPFGLTGPNSAYLGDDLIAISAGGMAFATPGVPDRVGDPDLEPPLRSNTHMAGYLAGVQGAMASIAALLSRALGQGAGCEIDLSMQEAVAAVMPFELAHASYHKAKGRQPGVFGLMPNAYLPCRDGYVVVMAVMEAHWRNLMDLAGNPDWADLEVFSSGVERARNWDALEPLLLEWTMAHTGAEIAQLAQDRGIPCFPAYTVGQMVDSAHVTERGFMLDMKGPGGEKFKLPGYPVRLERTPWQLFRPAPKLGEHTSEVLGEWLGYSAAQLAELGTR